MGRDDLFDLVVEVFDGEKVQVPENEVSVPFTPAILEGRRHEAQSAPMDPCWCCGAARSWRLKATSRRLAGPWMCARCHPPTPPAEMIELVTNAEVRDA